MTAVVVGGAGRGAGRRTSPRTDAAEQALRRWLVQRHHRAGDRLPADVELARMLGVARSTVIAALERLIEEGIITRRQGSGTFVRAVPTLDAVAAGMEMLDSYAERARRRGHAVALARTEITLGASAPSPVADALGLVPGSPVTRVRRVLRAAGRPCALLTDHLPPDAPVDDPEGLGDRLAAGGTLLGALLDAGLPVAYATTSLRPLLLVPGEPAARSLEIARATAAIEVHEVTHLAGGEPVKHSVDVVLPGGDELTLVRQLPAGCAPRPQPLPPRHAGALRGPVPPARSPASA